MLTRITRPSQVAALALALGAALLASSAHAATITAAGIDLNEPAWNSTGVTKPLDVDGDNRYGTDGYVIFGLTTEADNSSGGGGGHTSSAFGDDFVASNDSGATVYQGTDATPGAFTPGLAAYVSSFDAGSAYANTASNFDEYASGDDPRLASGAAVTDAQIGTVAGTSNSTVGDYRELFTFTVDADVPASFRVGVLFGNVNDFLTPTAIRIAEDGGPGVATITGLIAPGSPVLDWVFFDITGAAAGDTFSVLGQVRDRVGSTNNRVSLGGIVFDSATVIPSPAALPTGLVLLGGLMLRRRRR